MNVVERLTPRAGLRVLVTAGASGIGAVIAQAFHEAQAKVHICDIDAEALEQISAANPNIGCSQADVSSEEDVARLFEDLRGSLGGLDVAVNNAGIAGPTAAVDEISVEEWRRTIDINLNGQFMVARKAAALLRDSRGLLISISSVAGRLGYAYRTPYAASKWGVIGLTESLARELGASGVRVNALLPGIVRGERIRRVIENRARALGISHTEMEQEYLRKVSLRRMVEPEDVAAAALFLASPGGSNISGQAISVCGNVETL
jgi:NAD(P)-dependent dehydrogenase (short-subunit alcohol dehydrogenase family)